MPYNLLIIPLIAGFFILSNLDFFKYKYQRQDSRRILFNSALAGLLISFIGISLRHIVGSIFSNQIESLYKCLNFVNLDYGLKRYLWTMIFSLLGTILFTYIFNFLIRNSKWRDLPINMAVDEQGDELEKLLRDSVDNGWLLQFTLKTGKVYVGFVLEIGEPQKTRYIEIFPFKSGFRTNDEQRLKITTEYTEVFSILDDEDKFKDKINMLTLVLNQDEIIAVRPHDDEIFEQFEGHE